MTASDITIEFSYPGFDLEASFPLPAKGISGLFGPSGAGKTTLIRCLAGLERPARAHINVGGRIWQSDDIFLAPHERRLGLVFQDVRLFNHLSVRKNLLYGYDRTAPEDRKIRMEDVLNMLDLAPLLDKRPEKLSGGEGQRVAIGRALLTSPALLLMDEPLAALGEQHKKDILPYLKKLPREFGIPLLYVSHNFEEMASLADYMVCLNRGRIQAQGNWQDVATQLPDILDRWAPDNVIYGEISAPGRFKLSDGQVITIPAAVTSPRLVLNARDISLLHSPPGNYAGDALLTGTIMDITQLDRDKNIVRISLAGQDIHVVLGPRGVDQPWISVGQDIHMMINRIRGEVE
ncbi:MAG: molybdenum ABC transporter ATP-binding protein [Alphaproteobacteria bacterium]|nr:molybdenum ABC transporter ATP-binding protein [Alphaproteobacteria bacterium]